jgi:hypothetical protein
LHMIFHGRIFYKIKILHMTWAKIAVCTRFIPRAYVIFFAIFCFFLV